MMAAPVRSRRLSPETSHSEVAPPADRRRYCGVHPTMARPLHLAWALVLGACFTGGFLAGQPCMSDADCGPSLNCDGGFCGGASAGQTGAPETTSTTVEPTTTGVDPSTTGSFRSP